MNARHLTRQGLAATLGLAGMVGAAQAAGTLTVCIADKPEGLDVVQFETGVTINAAGVTLFDTLLRMAPGTTTVQPGLAERWEVSPDGLALTLHLRRNVVFHTTPWFTPTRPMNADDVVYSLERLRDRAHAAHGIAKAGYRYWEGLALPRIVRRTVKLDEHSVRIELLRPNASLPSLLTMPSIGSVYPAEYVAALLARGEGEQLNRQPAGSGPFVLRSAVPGLWRFEAHAQHWAGRPTIDRLILTAVPDNAVRAQKLKVGECAVGPVPLTEAAGIEADSRLRLLRHQPLRTVYLFVNSERPGLGDARLRQALRLAVDRPAVVQAAYAGDALVTANLIPPGMPGHDPALPTAADPARAAELVKAVGAAATREFTLFVIPSATVRRAAEVLQADWAKVGLKVAIRSMELAELYRRTAQGEHDIALASWTGDNGDPDNFFAPLASCAAVASGGNKGRLCDAALDALIDEGRRTSDPARRSELYRRASARVLELSALIPFAHPASRIVLSRRVEGFVPSPLGIEDYSRVRIGEGGR